MLPPGPTFDTDGDAASTVLQLTSIEPITRTGNMRPIVVLLAVLGFAMAAGADAVCTAEERIRGIETVRDAFVTGNENISRQIPFTQNATFVLYVQDVPLLLGVDADTSRLALQLLHNIQAGVNVTASDDGIATSKVQGTLYLSPLGLARLYDVPGVATFAFDNSVCLGYALVGHLYPLSGGPELVTYLKGLFNCPDGESDCSIKRGQRVIREM